MFSTFPNLELFNVQLSYVAFSSKVKITALRRKAKTPITVSHITHRSPMNQSPAVGDNNNNVCMCLLIKAQQQQQQQSCI